MRVPSGKAVISHSDGEIQELVVFVGKNANKEARAYFITAVVDDMRHQAEQDREEKFDEAEAREYAEEQDGNYTSEDGCGDRDILIRDLD